MQVGPRWFELEAEAARPEARRSRPPEYRIPAWLEQAATAEQAAAAGQRLHAAPAPTEGERAAPRARSLTLWCYLLALVLLAGMVVLGML